MERKIEITTQHPLYGQWKCRWFGTGIICPEEMRDLKCRENHTAQPHSSITVFEENNPSSNNSTCKGFCAFS